MFVGDEGSFTGHMAVFASQSRLLKEIFLSTPVYEEETVIIVPEAKDEELGQMVSFIYGVTRELKLPLDIFKRLELFAGRESLEPPSLNDHNSNLMENPEIDTAEVLIDNNELLTLSESHSPFFCMLCNNGFSSKAGLMDHLKNHPICLLCNNQFLRNSDLLEHWQAHPQCGICGDRLLNQAALEEHEVGHADLEESLTTLTANDPLIESAQLVQDVNDDLEVHEIQMIPRESDKEYGVFLKCDLCDEISLSMLELENHIAEDHFETEFKKFYPQLEVTDYDDEYQKILPVSCSFSQDNQFPVKENVVFIRPLCAICRVSFAKTRELSHHVITDHPVDRLDSGRVFSCLLCTNIGYLSLKDLETHNSLEHKDSTLTFQCPDCLKEFKTGRYLRNHIRIHLAEKAFQCGRCLSLISTENSLRAHIRKCAKVERKDIPYPQLEADLDVRTKRFTCKGCGKMFRSRINAELHVNSCGSFEMGAKINGDKTDKNLVCSDGVQATVAASEDESQFSNVNVNLHTRKFSYNCTICDRRFRKKNTFESHICNLPVEKIGDSSSEDGPRKLQKKFIETEVSDPTKNLAASEIHENDDTDMTTINRTSRSGRPLKRKKFFEDLTPPEEKRRRKRKCDLAVAGGRPKCLLTSTQCVKCELELCSHSELFRHCLVCHLPQEVVRTLPVYAEGDTGWCQTCQEPQPVPLAELHMAEKHQELFSLPTVITPPPACEPAVSNITEENHNQADGQEPPKQPEIFLEEVYKVVEEEEEFCTDIEKDVVGFNSVDRVEESSRFVSQELLL